MKTVILAAVLMIAPPAMADDHACALTHSNAAEMTLRYFVGGHPEQLPIDHATMAEMVENNPAWKAWERDKLICPPGACHCKETRK
jgi:hypothetical protein